MCGYVNRYDDEGMVMEGKEKRCGHEVRDTKKENGDKILDRFGKGRRGKNGRRPG